jgi:predicted RNA-binding protein Jag
LDKEQEAASETCSESENSTEEEQAKQLKKDVREKLKEVLKGLDLDETFTISLRTKQQKDYILDYPDRTICGCDGEVYNMLMNWAYKNQISNHLAFDRFVETFGKGLEDIKQRPESADRASRRYYKSQRKEGANPIKQLSLFSDSEKKT